MDSISAAVTVSVIDSVTSEEQDPESVTDSVTAPAGAGERRVLSVTSR